MAYYSKMTIFNITLNNLGITAPVSASTLTTDSRAIILSNFYEPARDEILKCFDWGFANTYKSLTLTGDTSPNPLYEYVYDCPNDCIAARAVIEPISGEEKKFMVYANLSGEKSILSNVESAVLRYTRKVTEEKFFSPEFALTLSYYLASLTAETITGSQKKAESCLKMYEYKLSKAKSMNANEGTDNDEDNSQYYDVR